MARSRWLVCVALFVVLASACGRSGDKEQGGGETTTTASGAASGSFGDLEKLCGPGDAKGATATGVTDTEINAADFADPGFVGRPGLDQELFDAGKVFAAWCNDAGGINGRKVVVHERDAKLTEYKQRVIESCREDFMIVGGGAVFDDAGQEDRLKCLLPTIAGFVVTPQARGADLTVQPVPNPINSVSVAAQRYVAKRFPASIDHVGYLTGAIQTTKIVNDQKLEAAPTLGFKTVYNSVYNPLGEATWTPFAQAIKSNGVRGLQYTGEPENAAKLLQALAEIGYQLDWFVADANHVDSRLIDIGGAAVKNVFIAGSVVPYSLAKQNPATQQYLDLFKKYLPNGKNKAYLGYQGFSAWLLFAQAVKACGSDVTRKCVYDKASNVTEWTGGGLHAPTNPSSNATAECVLVSEATPDGFVIPNDFEKTDGIFNCDAANAYKLKNDYGKGVTLADVGLSLADLK
jgi:ABC-type branched-subunit amino acid transport system substrate-binding protein